MLSVLVDWKGILLESILYRVFGFILIKCMWNDLRGRVKIGENEYSIVYMRKENKN